MNPLRYANCLMSVATYLYIFLHACALVLQPDRLTLCVYADASVFLALLLLFEMHLAQEVCLHCPVPRNFRSDDSSGQWWIVDVG